MIEHLEALERREIRKLCILLPPRHSKTLHASERFVGWYLGRNPAHQVIAVAYNQNLANTVSRRVRDLLDDDRRWPFPTVEVRKDAYNVEKWLTNSNGVYTAAGVGAIGGGVGADLLVLDDVVKSRDDIDSLAKRDALWRFYQEVISTRMMPKSVILSVQTSWSDDDLAARQIASSDEWVVLRMPAIAEESGDILGRKLGEALWPNFFPIEELLKKRAEMSSSSWSALYQQNPTPEDGTVCKAEWLTGRFEGSLPMMTKKVAAERAFPLCLMPGGTVTIQSRPYILQACDASWGLGTSTDFSAIVTVAYDGKAFCVMDCWRGRVPHPELTRIIETKYNEWRPKAVLIEAASAGYAAIQSLQVINRIPVIPITPRTSKLARFESVSVLFERGLVKFPNNAPWVPLLIDELLRLGVGAHDDMADALIHALSAVHEGVKVTHGGGTISRYSERMASIR